MQQETIIGVDIGTTSTKAVAFGIDGKLLFQYAVEYPIYSSQPSYAEQDPEQIFEVVLQTLQVIVEKLRLAGYSLTGVSFSSAMHSLIVLDAENNLLTNSITWADTRSKIQAEKLKQSEAGYEIYLHTGTPIHPMSVLPKLVWLREQRPELFARATRFIGIKEYVWYKLFGEFIVDYSVASATGLFNIFDLTWHQPSLQVAGISPQQLSDPVPVTHSNYKLRPVYKTRLNLPDNIPFIVGANDGCLANLGSNAMDDGHITITIGTSGAVRVMAKQPATDKLQRIFSYILTPEHYVLGGAVNNGGVVLQWFRDTFYSSETATAKSHNKDPYALLCNEAATVPAGADGLLFLPYLLGERAPVWDASASACFIGIRPGHTRAHFVRALLEGITFNMYSVTKALEQVTGSVSKVFANGGLSRSELWVQMLADVFNKEVCLTETYESSAFGAAIVGLYALGKIEKLEDAAQLVTITKTYTPNTNNHLRYQKSYRVFEDLYPTLKSTFSQLDDLRNEP
ncbi:gluconokinase [Pontibacter sp. BT310]|uniref:Gluconokinase n=1 Tax=Pontibacter populi TaxID=890055 RepID=A0ABS6X6R2_9BACT|nr:MULTISPECIES: gluconokinase [Pontibacter]MBJ6116712.1 gluconokinase [Pontibacter sp. BT310]MBR0569136.1 gluconokinase [Microvirga sp. STS03]MBW3363566.1 gluconokinase [Pontibacter populi]